MGCFIKIIDTKEKEHYLNVNYILKFNPLSEGYDGNTVLYLGGGEKVFTVQTTSTSEEIIDMINIASK